MIKILNGNCLTKLTELADKSVQCSVSSPPYWGLRDYGTPPQDWPACSYTPMSGMQPIEIPAWNGHLGLEPTPEMFIGHIVQIFRQVHRVLRDDGTLWMNFGDTYANSGSGSRDAQAWPKKSRNDHKPAKNRKIPPTLKTKDLAGIPWRVAFALQADGWYLRSDIIWSKPNPMPESVDDRPSKAHEYIFLLTKKENYFYDAEAIREKVSGGAHARGDGVNPKAKAAGKNSRENVDRDPAHLQSKATKQNASFSAAVTGLVSTRNKRSVWDVATYPYRDAHFATFPPDLIKPCILAGTSPKACEHCFAPFSRIVEKGAPDLDYQRQCGGDLNGLYTGTAKKDYASAKAQNASEVKARILAGMRERKTVGWEPTCKCECKGTAKCTVLDPFGGSGTTGEVSLELGREAVLIELNTEYIPLIQRRTTTTPGLGL